MCSPKIKAYWRNIMGVWTWAGSCDNHMCWFRKDLGELIDAIRHANPKTA